VRLTASEERVVWRRIESAVSYAKKTYHKELIRAIELYESKHYTGKKQPRRTEMIVVNKLKPAVEIQVAQISFNYPEFYLVPESADFEAAEPIARDALTYEWRRHKMQAVTKRCLRDCLIGGLGIGFTGWVFTTRDRKGTEDRHTEGLRPPVLGEAQDTTPHGLYGEAPPPEEEPVYPLAICEDDPFVRRIPPLDWWTDPETDAVYANAGYLGWTERVPLLRLKADPRLSGVGKLKGSPADEETTEGTDYRENDPDFDRDSYPKDLLRVTIHHYWEERRQIHAIVAEETKEPLLVEAWPHEHSGYPVAVMRVPGWEDRPYPRPPLLEVEHPQLEINQGRSLLSMQQRAATPKYQTSVRLTEANRAQIRSDKTMGLIELEEPGVIEPVRHPGIPPEIPFTDQTSSSDIRQLMGLDEYAAGAAPGKRVTEGEVQAIQQSQGARAQMTRQDYEIFVSELAGQVLSLLQQNSVKTRSLPIFDPATGAVADFRDYSPEEIKGEFLVSVYAGSTQAPNRQGELQELAFLFQSMPNLVQGLQGLLQVGIDARDAVVQALKQIPALRNIKTQPVAPAGLPMADGPLPGAPGMPGAAGQPMLPPGGGNAGSGLSPDILAQILATQDAGPAGPAMG
jgi:hypothetical protein